MSVRLLLECEVADLPGASESRIPPVCGDSEERRKENVQLHYKRLSGMNIAHD